MQFHKTNNIRILFIYWNDIIFIDISKLTRDDVKTRKVNFKKMQFLFETLSYSKSFPKQGPRISNISQYFFYIFIFTYIPTVIFVLKIVTLAFRKQKQRFPTILVLFWNFALAFILIDQRKMNDQNQMNMFSKNQIINQIILIVNRIYQIFNSQKQNIEQNI